MNRREVFGLLAGGFVGGLLGPAVAQAAERIEPQPQNVAHVSQVTGMHSGIERGSPMFLHVKDGDKTKSIQWDEDVQLLLIAPPNVK